MSDFWCTYEIKEYVHLGVTQINHFPEPPIDFLTCLMCFPIVLFYLSYYIYFSPKAYALGSTSLMRKLLLGYFISTAAFVVAVCIWSLSKILLIFAIIHNIFELGFFCHICFSEVNIIRRFNTSILIMYGIICLIASSSTLTISAYISHLPGAAVDYLIAYTFMYLLWTNKDKKLHDFYYTGLKASVWHFGHIIPLIFTTVVKTNIYFYYVVYFLITFSILPTYYYYAQLGFQWDEIQAIKTDKVHLPRATDVSNSTVYKLIFISLISSAATFLSPTALLWPCRP